MDYRSLSYWHDSLPDDALTPRPSLEGREEADVAVVGGGYTGLWTAHYLSRLQPDLRVTLVEAEVCGFGASGRNGGWATHEIAIDRERAAASHGRDRVIGLLREMCSTVDEIGKVAADEGIDCDFAKGGTLSFATNQGQVPRLRAMVRREHEWGFGEEDFRWLDRHEAVARARVAGALGAVDTPHCAAIHPAKLAVGLADAVERRGVRVYERSPAVDLSPGRVRTPGGEVRAEFVLRCTEAYGARLPGGRRRLVPFYSLMIATEALPEAVWEEIGLDGRPTFEDGRYNIIYGQRTADGRLAFGGRGAPYRFGSAIEPGFDRHEPTHRAVEAVLRRLFPQLGDAAVTHRWGGPVAIPRDWQASCGLDRETGTGWAGGYVGTGVAAANLAGRTLADLVLGRDTDLVRLPWVGHRSPRWEPEPLRWVGINTARLLAPAADAREARTGKPSRVLGGLFHLLTGR